MKIGVISDTHIPERAVKIPGSILTAFKHVDVVVHAGDMVNLEVIEELKGVCKKVIAVAGNMDNDQIKSKYPVKEIFKAGGFKIGLMHGYGAPNNLIDALKKDFKHDPVDIIIFGHSHRPMNETIDGVLFFNPGSATDTVTSEGGTYGIIEITDKVVARIIRI